VAEALQGPGHRIHQARRHPTKNTGVPIQKGHPMGIFSRSASSTAATSADGALPATTDTSGRRVPSEPAATYVVDTRGAERGRGCLSGDGQYHGGSTR
jgi:hypothetical protein